MSGDRAFRAALLTSLQQSRIPSSAHHEIVDLSLHAAQQAMESFIDVARRSSDHRINLVVFQIGLQLLQQRVTEKATELPILLKAAIGDDLVHEQLDVMVARDDAS